jgi:hypothetical protein
VTDAALALNGFALHSVSLHVGECGVWTAECRLTEAPGLATAPGTARLKIADTVLVGTIVESQAFGLALGARVVGGAGGWGKTLRRRSYHNDAGVRAQTLAEDAAREAGETLGTFTPGVDRVGTDYARRVASAASTLEYAAGRVAWHVDYAGVTHVAARAADVVPATAYSMLAYDPVERIAVLAVDDFGQLTPGRTLVDARLPGPMRIRDVELESTKGSPLRATVWCGTATRADAGRLADVMRSIVTRLTDRPLHGVYRYRVVTMRDDRRADLQAVREDAGLPDLPAVSQCPGIPGLAAELTEGSTVLVCFVDGDAAEPLITHYAGPGSDGFAPVGMIIGGDSGQPAARQNDPVEVLLPPAQFAGVIAIGGGAPSPAQGIVTWLVPKADGVIVGGSGKVKIA